MLFSILHIGISLASILINGVNIWRRRSAAPMIMLLLTLPMLVISLFNALIFDGLLPLILTFSSIPVSLAASLPIAYIRSRKEQKS